MLGGVLVGFPFLQYLFNRVGSVLQGDRETTVSDWFVFMLWIVLLEWALFYAMTLALKREDKSILDVGFPAVTRRDLAVISVGTVSLVAFILWAGDSTSEFARSMPDIFPKTREQKFMMLLVALTAGVCEETLFRGFCYVELRRRNLGLIWAVLLPTVSFVLIHGGIDQDLGMMAFRAAVAVLFAGIFIWRGTLRLPILLHGTVDASLVLII